MAEVNLNLPDELTPIEPDELVRALREEHRKSIGVENSEIPTQRAEALDRYHGEHYTDELRPVEGRSQVISRDTTDAVEWAMPQLVDVFFGGDSVVELEPQHGDDVLDAQLESHYLNHVFLKENNGFLEGHQAIKDAVLQKDGIIKAWVEEKMESEPETYFQLTEEELLVLLQDPYVEMVGRSESDPIQVQSEMGPQMLPTFDVDINRYMPGRCIKVKAIPPEEFKVSKRTRTNLQETPYCSHDEEYSKGELAELLEALQSPYTVEECMQGTGDEMQLSSSPERQARYRSDSSQVEYVTDKDHVVVHEEYILIDADGDGFDERIKVLRIGDKILHWEPHPLVPFAHLSAILLSHKFNGMSLADLVEDLGRIKTALTRNIMDNIYQQNNSRWAVVDGQVNMEDLLVSRPGGIVRETVSGAVRPLQAPSLPPQAFDLLGYFDQVRDERTGISKVSQGLDPNALSSNVAATAVNQVMTAAQQRMKLIAKVMSEGFRQLFWIIHELSRTHISGEQKFLVHGQPMQVDPSRFKKRTDLSIRVGLGTAEKDAQLTRLGMIAQDMQMIAANGGAGRVLQEVNVYNLAKERARIAGIKNPEMYYTDPSNLPPPEQKPSPEEVAAQIEQMKKEYDLKEKEMEIASEERIELLRHEMRMKELELKEKEIEAEIMLEKQQERSVEIGA